MSPEAIIALLTGTIGTMASVIVYQYRQHIDGDAKHHAADEKREAERDRREAILTAERDAWQHRWEGADGRLSRIATAWLKAFGEQAPE